jgi:DNA (cytosine-5)-methyltransferase 1
MNRLKVLELFSGIGAFTKALSNLKIDYDLIGFSDIDKYAIESYCAIHNVDKNLNLGDISKVNADKIPSFDLMTYSFPCQDISVAGKQIGFSEGSDTRSSLLWEAVRIAKYHKPKYLIAENVKNLIGKKFKEDFDKWIQELDEMGYNTYYDVLNAKNFNVPQSRERVFVVSIRKDIDNGKFEFPKGRDSGIRLKDILEANVDSKYYLSEAVQSRFKFNEKYHESIIGTTAPEFRTIGQRDLVYSPKGTMGCLVATDYKQPKQIIEVVGNLDIKGMDCIKRVYSPEGVSPTLTTMEGGNRQPKVMESQDKPKLVGGIGEENFGKQFRQGNRVYDADAIAMCLNASPVGNAGGNSYLYKVDYKIRKLTPKECWRLMGFSDEDFERAKATLNETFHKGKDRSDSQLYKQSGNSIAVSVCEALLNSLFE